MCIQSIKNLIAVFYTRGPIGPLFLLCPRNLYDTEDHTLTCSVGYLTAYHTHLLFSLLAFLSDSESCQQREATVLIFSITLLILNMGPKVIVQFFLKIATHDLDRDRLTHMYLQGVIIPSTCVKFNWNWSVNKVTRAITNFSVKWVIVTLTLTLAVWNTNMFLVLSYQTFVWRNKENCSKAVLKVSKNHIKQFVHKSIKLCRFKEKDLNIVACRPFTS